MIPTMVPELIPALIPPTLPDDFYFLPANCEVWLKMIEGTGTALADSSGKGIAGVITGASWVAGPVSGKVLSFDGAGDSIALALAIAGFDQSIEFWIAPAIGGAQGTLLSSQTGYKYIDIKTDGHLLHVDGNATTVPVYTFVNGVWVHVVCVVVSGVSLTLYCNGVPETVLNGAIGAKAIGGTTKLGAVYADGVSRPLTALMGCFRAYSRALSQAEVSALFAQDRARYGV